MRKAADATICTVCFPTTGRVAEDYAAGLLSQTEPCDLLLVAEQGTDTAILTAGFPGQVRIVTGAPAETGVALREKMLVVAGECVSGGAVIFADCDDRLEPTAVADHLAALAVDAISVGNMEITDGDGHLLGQRFFDGISVPDRIERPDAIAERNFFGLTNTAIRGSVLALFDEIVPGDVRAVDWWLFSRLLNLGCTATVTRRCVTRYRSVPTGTLGYGPARDLPMLLNRLDIVRRHQRHLKPGGHVGLDRLQERIDGDPDQVIAWLLELPQACVWYEDVFALAGRAQDKR